MKMTLSFCDMASAKQTEYNVVHQAVLAVFPKTRFMIQRSAVHGPGGKLQWTNWDLWTLDMTYEDAVLVRALLGRSGIHASITDDGEHRWGMFTEVGDLEVDKMLRELEHVPRASLAKHIRQMMEYISGKGHSEVHDTDVRERIEAYLKDYLGTKNFSAWGDYRDDRL